MGEPSRLEGCNRVPYTLLFPITGHHSGIEIERQSIDYPLCKQPAIQGTRYVRAGNLRTLPEQPHHRLKVHPALKAEQAFQHRVITGDLAVFNTIGPTSHRQHELPAARGITPITSRLRARPHRNPGDRADVSSSPMPPQAVISRSAYFSLNPGDPVRKLGTSLHAKIYPLIYINSTTYRNCYH